MNIRPAFSDDCPTLAAIDTVSNPSPWSVKQFSSALAQSTDKLWVCETDGVIGGLVGHYAGEMAADEVNSVIDSHMDNE